MASAGALASLRVIVSLMMREQASLANFDQEAAPVSGNQGLSWYFLGWLAGLIGLSAALGFFLGISIFFAAFLKVVAKLRWRDTVLLTASGLALLLVIARALHLIFPGGLLQSYVDLPWPLR